MARNINCIVAAAMCSVWSLAAAWQASKRGLWHQTRINALDIAARNISRHAPLIAQRAAGAAIFTLAISRTFNSTPSRARSNIYAY